MKSESASIFTLNRPQLIEVLRMIVSEVAPLDQAREVIEASPLLEAFKEGPHSDETVTSSTGLAFANTSLHRIVDEQKARVADGVRRELAAKTAAWNNNKAALEAELEGRMFNMLTQTQLQPNDIYYDGNQGKVVCNPESSNLAAFTYQSKQLDFSGLVEQYIMAPYREHRSDFNTYRNYKRDFEQASFFTQLRMAKKKPAATSFPDIQGYLRVFYQDWNDGLEGPYRDWFPKRTDVRLRPDWYELAQNGETNQNLRSLFEELDPDKVYRDNISLGDLLPDARNELANNLATIERNSPVHDLIKGWSQPTVAAVVAHYFDPLLESKLLLWYQMRTLHERLLANGELMLSLLPLKFQRLENRVSFYALLIEYLEEGRADSWKELINLYHTEQFQQELAARLAHMDNELQGIQNTIVAQGDQTRRDLLAEMRSNALQTQGQLDAGFEAMLSATQAVNDAVRDAGAAITSTVENAGAAVAKAQQNTANQLSYLADAQRASAKNLTVKIEEVYY